MCFKEKFGGVSRCAGSLHNQLLTSVSYNKASLLASISLVFKFIYVSFLFVSAFSVLNITISDCVFNFTNTSALQFITSAIIFDSDSGLALLFSSPAFEVKDTFVVCLLVSLHCFNLLYQDSCMQSPALILKLSSHLLHLWKPFSWLLSSINLFTDTSITVPLWLTLFLKLYLSKVALFSFTRHFYCKNEMLYHLNTMKTSLKEFELLGIWKFEICILLLLTCDWSVANHHLHSTALV